MKASLKLLSALLVLSLIVSCGEDEVKVETRHEVGNWELANYAIINLPDAFARLEGRLFEVGDLSTIKSYTFSLTGDNKYSREINFEGKLPQKDVGSWTLDDEEFNFKSESFSDNESLTVEKNEDRELWLSFSATFTLIPDSTILRLSNEYPTQEAYEKYFDDLTDEEYNALTYQTTLDLVQLFDKK